MTTQKISCLKIVSFTWLALLSYSVSWADEVLLELGPSLGFKDEYEGGIFGRLAYTLDSNLYFGINVLATLGTSTLSPTDRITYLNRAEVLAAEFGYTFRTPVNGISVTPYIGPALGIYHAELGGEVTIKNRNSQFVLVPGVRTSYTPSNLTLAWDNRVFITNDHSAFSTALSIGFRFSTH